jgi:hypothetical protein
MGAAVNNDRRRLDEPRTVRRVVFTLYTVCGALLLADLLYVKHPHFSFEGWFGFYPIFGFGVSFSLVLAAKELRRLLRREEDYYERRERAHHDE